MFKFLPIQTPRVQIYVYFDMALIIQLDDNAWEKVVKRFIATLMKFVGLIFWNFVQFNWIKCSIKLNILDWESLKLKIWKREKRHIIRDKLDKNNITWYDCIENDHFENLIALLCHSQKYSYIPTQLCILDSSEVGLESDNPFVLCLILQT